MIAFIPDGKQEEEEFVIELGKDKPTELLTNM